jgi:hypothetical protein
MELGHLKQEKICATEEAFFVAVDRAMLPLSSLAKNNVGSELKALSTTIISLFLRLYEWALFISVSIEPVTIWQD